MSKDKKALIIEGGGMKAAYANGVLSAFEEAGYYPWDLILGTSAGGALAAWYSAGQAVFAEDTWAYAKDPRILSYRRWALRRGPLLDHEALLDIVYQDEHPLDVAKVKAAKWPIVVTAVDADTGATVYHDIRKGDTIQWLKATGRLPLACGDPVEIDGRRLVDGGTVDPIPVRYALSREHCTDLTLITNKPLGLKRSDPRFIVKRAAKVFPALEQGLLDHQYIKWESVQMVLHPPPGVEGTVIHPSRPTKVTRLDRNQTRIDDAIAIGRHDGVAHLRALDAL